jgi:hypothetical protein
VRFSQEVLSIHLISPVVFEEDGHGSIRMWDIIHCILTQNGFSYVAEMAVCHRVKKQD